MEFWFDPVLVNRWLPEGGSGEWSVRRKIIEGERSVWLKMGGNPEGGTSPPGTYTELWQGECPRMSDDVCLLQRDREFVAKANGNILLTGLGLGIVAVWLAAQAAVSSVDVVELSADVIALVGPFLPLSKVHVIHGDAFEFTPRRNYDFVLHDCFTQPRNLELLFARYAKHTKWQGVSHGD